METTHQRNSFDHVLVRIYTLNWEVIAYATLFVLAVFTRFWDLGERVMSHDESLHTYYSWELYDSGRFEHTPLMHGPLLFHMTAFFYFLFGPSDFSARIYVAILGVLIVLFPVLFRRWLGKIGAICVSIGLLLSPMLLYYSRYIRHDIPTIFFALVMLYAALQYVDGERPRRPVWIAVFSGAMLLMLASKEVAFIYIAIFGSFLTLYWILRMIQDVLYLQKTKRSLKDDGDVAEIAYSQDDEISFWLWLGIQGLVLAVIFVFAFFIGSVFYEFYKADPSVFPEDWSQNVVRIGMFFVVLVLRMVSLVFLFAVGSRPHLTRSIANGLRNTHSVLLLITTGAVIGGVMALWIIGILDIIKADNIFVKQILLDGRVDIDVDETALTHFLEWTLIPCGLLIFGVLLIGVLKRTPWQDILVVLLVAFLFVGLLIFVERHSHPEVVSGNEPVAIDPNATSAEANIEHDNTYIFLAWMVCGAMISFTLVTRLLTSWWEFASRQPVFDILIVMGTMIFPWLAAFPLFWAGYKLDEAPLLPDTLEAAIVATVPFLLVSASVGLAWNWRVWPVAVAVFATIFLVFYTTFFTNGNGVGTGLIGSLGYWLEQQDVRRGSQPQYYYTLTQLPVYEYLPMIVASLAGFAGLSWVFEYRAKRQQPTPERSLNQFTPERDNGYEYEAEEVVVVSSEPIRVKQIDGTLIVAQAATPLAGSAFASEESQPESDDGAERLEELVSSDVWEWEYREVELPRWAQPYDHEIELARRNDARIDYLGSIPFLQLIGYWAIVMIVGLTIAGEKMPWLTTHLTLPLIFAGGWYVGRVLEHLNWSSLRSGGWVLPVVILPIFFVALAETILPYTTGTHLPFQSQLQEDLRSTGKWMAAFIVLIVTGYFALRVTAQIGLNQSRRLFFGAGVIFLAFLTLRTAWMFSFLNYDYATEFGVYAHSGPAVKDVLADLMYFADHSPEGMNIHVAYDDDSSWPMLWYLRDFTNKRYLWGTADDVRNQVDNFQNALVVIVGNRKNAEVARILGNDYYRFDLIRLWWPMQEYFHLNYDRIANIFEPDSKNPAASAYRGGMWDIWWSRDYSRYAQAMCIEREVNACYLPNQEEVPLNEREFDQACIQRVQAQTCATDDRFNVEKWPVSDELYMYVRKDFAVQIWDAGLDGQSVAERLIPDPEDVVETELAATTSFGTGILQNPRDLATDTVGNLYVADTVNDRIAVFSPDGTLLRTIGDSTTLNEPWGIAISPLDGNLYVADTWNYRVVVFTPEGDLVTSFGEPVTNASQAEPFGLYGPRDVAVDLEGYVYVADTGNHRIRVYTPDFQFSHNIVGQGNGLVGESEPVGVAIHPISGEVYVAETWNQRVSVFKRDGTFVDSWEVNMWAGTRTSPHRPFIAISPDGTLILVSDMDGSEGNNGPRVVAYDLRGNSVISFNAPLIPSAESVGGPLGVEAVGGIAFGLQGEVYVADALTSRIVVFPALGISGNIAPVPDIIYGRDTIGDTSSVSDDAALQEVGFAYWQALTTGNYDLYRAIHCIEDQEFALFPQDVSTFRTNFSAPYLGASLRELVVLSQIDGDKATIMWGGLLVFRPGTDQESRATAGSYSPLTLVKREGVWQICANTVPDFFRPGGG